jgi:hypothetical protein
MEILLTKVSSSFTSNENGKISFDHYKAMFGFLTMLRTIAQTYKYSSFGSFIQLNVHFLHAYGKVLLYDL